MELFKQLRKLPTVSRVDDELCECCDCSVEVAGMRLCGACNKHRCLTKSQPIFPVHLTEEQLYNLYNRDWDF